jgi:hypothetical protein
VRVCVSMQLYSIIQWLPTLLIIHYPILCACVQYYMLVAHFIFHPDTFMAFLFEIFIFFNINN